MLVVYNLPEHNQKVLQRFLSLRQLDYKELCLHWLSLGDKFTVHNTKYQRNSWACSWHDPLTGLDLTDALSQKLTFALTGSWSAVKSTATWSCMSTTSREPWKGRGNAGEEMHKETTLKVTACKFKPGTVYDSFSSSNDCWCTDMQTAYDTCTFLIKSKSVKSAI